MKKFKNVIITEISYKHQLEEVFIFINTKFNIGFNPQDLEALFNTFLNEHDNSQMNFKLNFKAIESKDLYKALTPIPKDMKCKDFKYVKYYKLKYHDKSDTYKKLVDLTMQSCPISEKQDKLNSIMENELTEEELDISLLIDRVLKLNRKIDIYNKYIEKMLDTNEFAAKTLEIVKRISNNDKEFLLGIIEIGNFDYTAHELILILQLDYLNVDISEKNIYYEGTAMMADIYIRHNSYIHKFEKFIQNITDSVNNFCLLQSTFTIDSTHDINHTEQFFLSDEEFECVLNRQFYNIEQKANVIFKNLYKLLVLLEADIIARID